MARQRLAGRRRGSGTPRCLARAQGARSAARSMWAGGAARPVRATPRPSCRRRLQHAQRRTVGQRPGAAPASNVQPSQLQKEEMHKHSRHCKMNVGKSTASAQAQGGQGAGAAGAAGAAAGARRRTRIGTRYSGCAVTVMRTRSGSGPAYSNSKRWYRVARMARASSRANRSPMQFLPVGRWVGGWAGAGGGGDSTLGDGPGRAQAGGVEGGAHELLTLPAACICPLHAAFMSPQPK